MLCLFSAMLDKAKHLKNSAKVIEICRGEIRGAAAFAG
jgi:hypothetical protein